MPVPDFSMYKPATKVYVGDCRHVLPGLRAGLADLIFADPPFDVDAVPGERGERQPREDYLAFTEEWLDACLHALAPHGAMWVNIADDFAAEVAVHLKSRGLRLANWCIWHFRFGQHSAGRFIVSKVHALYFVRDLAHRVWNADEILEPSDRAAIYDDARTQATRQPGMRVPLDVWYGQYWGRIQGSNRERRPLHRSQLPEIYLERVVRACSRPGDLVLDPFLGSGTTGVVARALGRRFAGIEVAADLAASAFERIAEGPARPLGQANRNNNGVMAHRRRAPKAIATVEPTTIAEILPAPSQPRRGGKRS